MNKLNLFSDFDLSSLQVEFTNDVRKSNGQIKLNFNISLKNSVEIDSPLTRIYDAEKDDFEDLNKPVVFNSLEGKMVYNPFVDKSKRFTWFCSVKSTILSNNQWDVLEELLIRKIRDHYLIVFKERIENKLVNHNNLVKLLEGFTQGPRHELSKYSGNPNESLLLNEIDVRTINMDKHSIGDIYIRNGSSCLLCKIRKKLVPYTPEEIIRQKVISYLISDLKIPIENIEVEVPLVRFTKGKLDRADIIVFKSSYDKQPLLLIECKAEGISLTESVYQQIERYNKVLGAHLSIVTNGTDFITYRLNNSNDREYLKNQLTFKMIFEQEGLNFEKQDPERWIKTDLNEIKDDSKIKSLLRYTKKYAFADDIPYDKIEQTKAVINLIDLLMDETSSLDANAMKELSIKKDGGVRLSSYGNSSGGDLLGKYRYFIVKDSSSNDQIVSFAIYKQAILHPPYLMVAIDDMDKSHHSLEMDLFKHIKVVGNNIKILHDGKMALGQQGAVSPKIVNAFVRKTNPELFEGDQIVLGTFNKNEKFTWQSTNTIHFLKNIINYSLLRDKLRASLK